MSWNGVSILDLDVLFLGGFNYCDPVLPDSDPRDYGVWRFDYLVTQQKYSFLYSLVSEFERRGKRVISPVSAHLATFMKPMMLERLRQADFAVPATITTNRKTDAEEFRQGKEAIVWRPATGKAMVQLFADKQLAALMQPERTAVILADVVPGPLLRGYVFDGKPWLLLQYKNPDYEMEETLEYFLDVSCPEVEADLQRLATELKAPWMQVSFVVNDGKPFIYDVDTDPSYADLPKVYEDALRDRIAASLTGNTENFKPTGSIAPGDPHPRPTMFLRRMLDVLYDFEKSKYS